MIDESKIKEAAGEWAAEHPSPRPNVFEDKKEGFIYGVQWAQQEFVKNLWHDASEEPKRWYELIVVITEGDADVYNIPFEITKEDWDSIVEEDGAIKWCYLSDILQKEGGER